MDYLESIDGKHRFLPTKNIYDIDRIHIENIAKVIPKNFFNKEDCILFNASLDGITQEIVWYPTKNNFIYVDCHPNGMYVQITNNVISILNSLYNDKTNKLI